MAVWESVTLKDLFPGAMQSAEKLLGSAQNLMDKTQAVLLQINQKANALQNIVSTSQALLETLEASGFYKLELPPAQGDLRQRISSAENYPNVAYPYSAGLVIGIIAPDFDTVAQQYQKLFKILTTPIQIPE